METHVATKNRMRGAGGRITCTHFRAGPVIFLIRLAAAARLASSLLFPNPTRRPRLLADPRADRVLRRLVLIQLELLPAALLVAREGVVVVAYMLYCIRLLVRIDCCSGTY
jgi:hypothetical protein